MTSKEALRKQADFISERFKKLNDDFLTMYGYLIFEYLDSGKLDVKKSVSSVKSSAALQTRKVKSDMKKVFVQQYKDNGFTDFAEEYIILFPSILDDFQNQLVISVTENGKTVYVSLEDAIKKIDGINKNDADKLAKQIADSGLRIRQNDLSYKIDNFIRYSTLKGIKDINLQVSDILFERMGANGFEVDYHENPRPSHAYMGGRQFVVGKARTINGIYFESFEEIAAPRLREPNCLHFTIPIVCGVTKPLYTSEQLAQWRKADQAKVKYAGKDFTRYEASQVQRRLEEEIRRCDDRLKIAKPARLEYMRRIEQSKRRVLFTEYEKFSKACGLETKIKKR